MYSCKVITQDFHYFSFRFWHFKGFGHFQVFEDFSLAASFFKYSSTSSYRVSSLLLVVPEVLFRGGAL